MNALISSLSVREAVSIAVPSDVGGVLYARSLGSDLDGVSHTCM